MSHFLRERGWPAPRASGPGRSAPLPRTVVISLAIALFLALSGIFGMGGVPLATRLAYWGILVAAGNLVAIGLLCVIRRRGLFGGHVIARWAAPTVLMTPLTALVWLVDAIMFGHALKAVNLLLLLPNVLLVAAAMTAINILADRPPATPAPEAPGAAPPPFVERLPFRLRGATIRAVQAEDHYLRVHTDAGDALILMRLSDALAELQGLQGARTHRSWWVARDAVIGVRRGRGRAVFELAGGLEAPVSRSFAPALREEGWF